jgi:hypothetical protein
MQTTIPELPSAELPELTHQITSAPATLADQIIERQRSDEQQRQADESSERKIAMRHYVGALQRAAEPQEGDRGLIADIMQEYKITPEQLRSDLETIGAVPKLLQEIVGREKAGEVLAKANEFYNGLERKHREELGNAFKAKTMAQSASVACGHALIELSQMAKARPDLFDTTSSPPTLLAG